MNRRYLDVRYDVTTLDDDQIGNLALEAAVQGEATEGHPSVSVESEVNDVEEETRTVLVHINVQLPEDTTIDSDHLAQLRREVADCLSLGLDNIYATEDTPMLAAAVAWDVCHAEEV